MKTVRSRYHHSARRERGAVLVVGLIMLAVMTLFVISMLKTSVIELKIGGASQIAALNFSNAELAINSYITNNAGRFAPGFLTSGTQITTMPPVQGGSVTLQAQQVTCGPWAPLGTGMGLTSLAAVYFDLAATGTGTLGGRTTVHQGVESLAAAGSC
jgi:hypothetical protein